MTRKAVLGTEVSIDSDVANVLSFSRREMRLSTGNRTASGPKLQEREN